MQILSAIKQGVERRIYGDAAWALWKRLDIFVPNVAADRADLVRLSFLAAEQVFPLLHRLVEQTHPGRTPLLDIEDFCATGEERENAAALKRLFDMHGSDKASHHNYHLAYGAILHRMSAPSAMLEIGLGTNDPGAVSTMGASGRPGASLRAFRDHLPGTRVVGGDVDRRILFQEDRITTVFLDQTDLSTFAEAESLGPYGLIIDDGLHAPNANIAVLLFAVLGALRPGGWLVIEDIPMNALPIWVTVGALLPADWKPLLLRARHTLLFVVQRPAP